MASELLLAALRHVWTTLASVKVDAALMGGLAVAGWKHLRNTRDVDLLIGVAIADAHELLERLRTAGIKSLRQPPIMVVGESHILPLSYEPSDSFVDIRIDLFFADSEFYKTALARRLPIVLPGMVESISILSCEDLILFKLLAGRIIDRSDAAYLARYNGDTLDQAYLAEWTRRLAIESDFVAIWREAFPGS